MAIKSYQIGDFVLETKTGRLFHHGKVVSISSKAFEILQYLTENQGKIVKKAELLETVWSDSFVEESNLPVHISALRRVFGEKRGESRFIKTIPGRGYSFVAPVRELSSTSNVDFATKSFAQDHSREPLSIAVMPFTFDQNNSDFEYLANGVTQSLIDDLSQSASLKVLAYSAVRNYRGSSLEIEEIGFLLGANKILTGHISQYKNELEINVELLNANDKSHVWSAQQFFNLNDIFLVKKEISVAIAEKLKLKLNGSNGDDFVQQEINPEAQKLYYRGKFVWDSRPTKTNIEENLRLALNFFEQAVELEPTYALAYTGIGSIYFSLHNHHYLNVDKAYAETKKALQTALNSGSQISQVYILKGVMELYFERSFALAEKSIDQAIKLNPSNAEAYHWKSVICLISARFDESIEMATKALQFDSTSLLFIEQLVRIPFFSGDYIRSIIQAEEIIEFEKNYIIAYIFSALSYAHLGYFKQALENIVKTIEIRCTPETLLTKAYIHALMNDNIEAKQIISNVLNQYPEIQIDWADMAYVYSAMGDTGKAFEMLEKAFEAGSTSLCVLKVDKRCDSLRSDARFEMFLERLCLR